MGYKTVAVEFCDLCHEESVQLSHQKLIWDNQKILLDICDNCHHMVSTIIFREIPGMSRHLENNPPKTAAYRAAEGVDLTEVRDWAHQQGIEVSKRGRISAKIIEEFKTANGIQPEFH